MIRKIRTKIFPAVAVLLLFMSCDRNDYPETDIQSGSPQKISFEMVYASPISMSSAAADTRIYMNGNYTSFWENDDEVGVYIVKGSGGLQASDNWVNNMKMTYNNGNWTYTFPSGKGYYPADSDQLNFYAYYPYNSAVTDALNMPISGLTDQSSATNLSKSDLLSASTLNVGKRSTPVQLSFSHALTMVELSVTGGGTGAQMSSSVAVTLEGCIADISFNLSTRAAGTSGSMASIKMYRVEQSGDAEYLTKYTYRAMVPTQTVFPGAELFRFSQTQGTVVRTLSHQLSSQVALYPGHVKPYTITLQNTLDPNHVYTVGDYYPYKGFLIEGVVFEVSNEGKNGKVVDLDKMVRIRWGTVGVDEANEGVVGIRDTNDGQPATKNMIIKRRGQANFTDEYAVFNWIYQGKNKGDIDGPWYLPATTELTRFTTVFNADQSAFNAKLKAAGYDEIWDSADYRSSTENNSNLAYLVRVGTNSINTIVDKENTNWGTRARAIRKF